MRKKIISILICILLGTTSILVLEAKSMTAEETVIRTYESVHSPLTRGYTNITVDQAWELVTNTSNGMQRPIDVRYDSEWITAHIDTPAPENPHHWPSLQNGVQLSEFMEAYQGKEIILYCKTGGRSKAAAELLVQNNFDGIIYNMLGGIDAWVLAGYPTIPNSPPDTPQINGDENGKPGQEYQYTFTTTDIDGDGISYYVNWSDNTPDQLVGPFDSGEAITLSHTWSEKGTYTIKAKAKDRYNAESDWAYLSVTMPCSYDTPIHRYLELLFQRFPHAFPILRHLMGY
ncbi:MAG: rhodanese-like domain-containing protein [Candidatus Thermoplasmatota archaeon]